MALYNITAQSNVLIVALDTSGNDVNAKTQTFNAPSVNMQGDKIRFFESGNLRMSLLFTLIGEINGSAPTDIEDAVDKINDLISANFSSGGATPRHFREIVDNGYTFAIGDEKDYLAFDNEEIILDGSLDFQVDDELQFQGVLTFPLKLTIQNADVRISDDWGVQITEYFIQRGDICYLKKVTEDGAVDVWFLNVVNKGTNLTLDDTPTQSSDNPVKSGGVYDAYTPVSGGSFNGVFSLAKIGGTYYNDLTQTGSLTLSSTGAVLGGFAVVRLTANGSSITPDAAWENVGAESLSTTNGVINFITIQKTANKIVYAVKTY